MTNTLLPFDPKLAKSELNPDGLEVVSHRNGLPVAFIGMSKTGKAVAEDGDYLVEKLRLRPRMVKRVIDIWNDRVWTINGHRRGNPSGNEIYVIKTIEIEVPEGV